MLKTTSITNQCGWLPHQKLVILPFVATKSVGYTLWELNMVCWNIPMYFVDFPQEAMFDDPLGLHILSIRTATVGQVRPSIKLGASQDHCGTQQRHLKSLVKKCRRLGKSMETYRKWWIFCCVTAVKRGFSSKFPPVLRKTQIQPLWLWVSEILKPRLNPLNAKDSKSSLMSHIILLVKSPFNPNVWWWIPIHPLKKK